MSHLTNHQGWNVTCVAHRNKDRNSSGERKKKGELVMFLCHKLWSLVCAHLCAIQRQRTIWLLMEKNTIYPMLSMAASNQDGKKMKKKIGGLNENFWENMHANAIKHFQCLPWQREWAVASTAALLVHKWSVCNVLFSDILTNIRPAIFFPSLFSQDFITQPLFWHYCCGISCSSAIITLKVFAMC